MLDQELKTHVCAVTPFAATPGDEVIHGIAITCQVPLKPEALKDIGGKEWGAKYPELLDGTLPIKGAIDLMYEEMSDLQVFFPLRTLPVLNCELSSVSATLAKRDTPMKLDTATLVDVKFTIKIQRCSAAVQGAINHFLREEVRLRLTRSKEAAQDTPLDEQVAAAAGKGKGRGKNPKGGRRAKAN